MPATTDLIRLAGAFVISYLFASNGYKKRSLSFDGMYSAIIVGTISFGCGVHFGIIVIAFFVSSSRLTKLDEAKKKKLEDEYKEGGQRNGPQVMSNSFLSLCIALWYYRLYGGELHSFGFEADKFATALQCAYIAFYACVTGDTWASEIGIIAKGKPVHILNFQLCPPGTNGGISLPGTLASIAGGVFISLTYFLCLWATGVESLATILNFLIFGAVTGFFGSMLDSFLGATLQFSGLSQSKGIIVEKPSLDVVKIGFGFDVLTGNEVNFLSSGLTSVLFAFSSRFFFP